jgi:hypothetical protein
MLNWTKDERVAALLPQILAHINDCDEFSLEHEEQLELIRDEYMRDLWQDYRGEDTDAFEDWHNQPTVEEFIIGETE